MSQLRDRHRDELRASGLSDETIELSGIYSATSSEAAVFLGFDPRSPGWVIPYPHTGADGSQTFRRFKPDVPFDTGRGKPAKYLAPRKTAYPGGNRLYIPPNLDPAVLADPTKPLVITEGEKKALKANQDGLPTVALAGVTCWVSIGDDGESRPIADLDRIVWPGRRVVILFDSDAVEKEEVRWEEYKLYRELQSRGATCRAGRLPKPTVEEDAEHGLGGRLGLDDFLMIRGTVALSSVLECARAPRKPPGRNDKKEETPRHHDVAREYIRDNDLEDGATSLLRWWRSTFWKWNGRAYREVPDPDVRADLMRYVQSRADLQARCTRRFVADVQANLEGMCVISSAVEPPAWIGAPGSGDARRCIVLENGILNVDALMAEADDVLEAHAPALFTTNALPYGFDPEARAPGWDQFLERVLPDATARELLQEWFGYCLLPESWLQRFVVMVGEGANGKSVASRVLAALLGPENVSAVPVERFRDSHNLVGTLGKLANISAEFEEIDQATEGTLKAFVAGDAIEFNPKYKPTFSATPTARLTVAANGLPHFKDKSSGTYRRMVVIPFPVIIPESEQDSHLGEKLTGELPGILNWALVGLFRLLERGRLAEPTASVEFREQHRRACNSARAFVEENLAHVPGAHLSKQTVYDEYKTFCTDRGFKPLNEPHFATEVYRYFGAGVTTARLRLGDGRVRTYVYDGLAWEKGDDGPGGPGGPSEFEYSAPESDQLPLASGPGGLGGPSHPSRIPIGSRCVEGGRDEVP